MELWDLYDADRRPLGRTMVRGEPQPPGTYRFVIHVCIFNERGEMLLQQRQPFKKSWSNLWDVTVGGSAVAGERSQDAAHRELLEELGLDVSFEGLRPALTVSFDGGFDDWYLIRRDVDVSECALQYEEVQAVRWAGLSEALAMLEDGRFIPYHKGFLECLFFLRGQNSGMHTRPDTTK